MNTHLKTLRMFWRENMRHPFLTLGCSISWTLGITLQRLVLALIAARALNTLVEIHNQPNIDVWHVFGPYLLVFAIVGIVAQILIDFGLLMLSKLTTRVRPQLQNRAFGWLLSQSLAFHSNTFSGALVNQVSKFTSAYNSVTDIFVSSVIKMAVTVVVATGIIAFFSPVIAGAMAVWTGIFVWLNLILVRRRIRYSKIAARAETAVTAHLADAMGNIAAIKAFGKEEDEHSLHAEKTHDRAMKRLRAWMIALQGDIVLGMLMTTLQFGILALSIVGVIHNSIDIGTLLLIQVYIMQIVGELWNLSNVTRTLEQNFTDAEEMTEIFDIQPDVQDPENPKELSVQGGGITFNSVSFAHEGMDDGLFQDFSLAIKPGEKIGLVGRSGSGKTTLTRLLLRFSDIDSGEILIDGQNIAAVAQADLRKHIAYVPQEPMLFHRSLRENIAYGDSSVPMEAIEAAARKAYAHEFIEQLPDKYETLVGERGVKLSGGQRQRIAIARAILKNAPILVLDEATSALDSESEKLIQQALGDLMQNRTAIIIAHRLSTIQKMDRIVVMSDGKIAEQGSHQELIAKKDAYAQLWAHQSGGFIEE
jgi:ATP-binding cassette subfamily B protein